jgi:hypothetical protein
MLAISIPMTYHPTFSMDVVGIHQHFQMNRDGLSMELPKYVPILLETCAMPKNGQRIA